MKERISLILNILMCMGGIVLIGWCLGFLINESYLHYRQHQRISAIEQDFAEGLTPASIKFRHDFIELITHAVNTRLCSETIDEALHELMNNRNEALPILNIDYIQEQSQSHNADMQRYTILIQENCR